MICPHCNTGVNIEWDEETYVAKNPDRPEYGYEVVCGECPVCKRLITLLQEGKFEERKGESGYTWISIGEIEKEELLYPKYASRKVEAEVPLAYRDEYLETCAVLPISSKASAALSRRLLQKILREEFNIQHKNLAQEIDEFIQRKDVPTYLSEAVDAVRNIGNFAAHPLKNTSTGEIVDVEPGEAEWLLEVLEALFDFAFVQPTRLQQRKDKLNNKLQTLGKPPMKS